MKKERSQINITESKMSVHYIRDEVSKLQYYVQRRMSDETRAVSQSSHGEMELSG